MPARKDGERRIPVVEVAAQLSLTRAQVRRRIRLGQIEAINVGTERKRNYRIAESEVTRYVNATRV